MATYIKALYTSTNTGLKVHTHYQGTWHKVIDETGATLEQYSFDPWGRRRNPADWSYNNVPTAYQFDRGYTSHSLPRLCGEMLDAFGLINMNGRVYDPLMARFLSPDNYVQLPDNTQGFNRYSYCLNNPLKYTDPSGEFIPLVYAAVAMYITMQGVIQGDLAYSRGGSFWEGFALGSITACISMSIGPIIGPLVQGPGALASAANAAANAAIAGGITYGISSLVTGEPFDWKGYGLNVGMAALMAGVDAGLYSSQHGGDFFSGKGTCIDALALPTSEDKITVGDGMDYTNEYAKSFSDENFGEKIRGLNDIHADGTLPDGYYKKGDLVFNKYGKQVRGTTIYLGRGKGSDVFLYKVSFTSTRQLYVTMGHEYIHVAHYNYGLFNKQKSEHAAMEWEQTQSKAFGIMPYNHTYKSTLMSPRYYDAAYDYTKFMINPIINVLW